MNSNDYGTCVITFDNRGKATVKVTGKGKFEGYTCNGNSTNMECVKSDVSEPTSRKCTTNNAIVDNLKFVYGQYTYRYNSSLQGWKVELTDKSSTDPVTTELCGTINDKPIVSMNNMFNQSKATSIDLSSFDTSNVTDMSGMFYYSITTTGYVRSQEDADRFNASSNKPSELTFVVKS